MEKLTEEESHYRNLEKMSTEEILININREDQKVAFAVENVIGKISRFVDELVNRMLLGGRLFYIGAGTSGRLGILDASECPPTFGVPHDWVIGLIAGGDGAIRKAVEFAEDDEEAAWSDILPFGPTAIDTVVGIAASGTTPYVVGGIRDAANNGLLTACITCNPGAPVTEYSAHPIEIIVGPEFLTGSTRMKAGTAQKMVLNMISTTAMIKIGKVLDNKMVDMQLSNQKLVERGSRMISENLGFGLEKSKKLLLEYGSVRKVLNNFKGRD